MIKNFLIEYWKLTWNCDDHFSLRNQFRRFWMTIILQVGVMVVLFMLFILTLFAYDVYLYIYNNLR